MTDCLEDVRRFALQRFSVPNFPTNPKLTSMSLNYTRYPYSKWSKCPHTCEHPTSSRQKNTKATYKVDNETVVVGSIKVFHSGSRMLRSHCINPKVHPKCDSQCPMKKWLGNENASNGDFQTPLTSEEWRRWGLGIALANATLETSANDIPQEYINHLLAEFPEERVKVLEKRGERTDPHAPGRATQNRSEAVAESPLPSPQRFEPSHSSTIVLERPPSAGPSTSSRADLALRDVHDQSASSASTALLPVSISPVISAHRTVPSASNLSPSLPRSSVQPSNPANIHSMWPRQPITYRFTDWTSNSMLLIPPPTTETQLQEPVYQISSSLGLNPFLPICYVTQVRRPNGELVGQFEYVHISNLGVVVFDVYSRLSVNLRWGILLMGEITTRISNVISSIDNNPVRLGFLNYESSR